MDEINAADHVLELRIFLFIIIFSYDYHKVFVCWWFNRFDAVSSESQSIDYTKHAETCPTSARVKLRIEIRCLRLYGTRQPQSPYFLIIPRTYTISEEIYLTITGFLFEGHSRLE